MAKFAVGEIAIIAWSPTNPLFMGRVSVGDEVEIVRICIGEARPHVTGPTVDGRPPSVCSPADYECRHPGGFHFLCDEPALRKRPQRGIPDEVLRLFEAPITEDATA